jgi:hypothetical protein
MIPHSQVFYFFVVPGIYIPVSGSALVRAFLCWPPPVQTMVLGRDDPMERCFLNDQKRAAHWTAHLVGINTDVYSR